MERAGSDLTAFGETVVFLDYFKDLPDPRQAGKVIYPLPEVLLLCLLAVLAGAETFVDIARFGEKKIALLRRFRPFRHGTPAHDHLGDILSVLDAEQFQRCFVDWVAALTGAPKEVIAIDGKTLRRSGGKKGAQAAVHMVSAFAAHQRHGLPRRRMPRPNRSGARQLHHPQAHGPQPHPQSTRQGFTAPQTKNRRMGRRLPRKPPHRIIPSPDSPAGSIDRL